MQGCVKNDRFEDRMRVLMISKSCLVGSYQRKLEEMAAQPGVELTVVVPPSWRDSQGELKLERVHVKGYRLVVDPIRFNGSYHLHYYPRLKKRLGQFQPEIIHIDEEPYNLATWHAWRLARSAGARSLFFSWQNLLRRYPFPFNWMEQAVLRGVDYAIAGSQGAADVWRRKGYTGPLAVIPQFGVDPDIFAPPARRDAGRGLVIGYAGRLVPEKGIDLLVRAAARLPGAWQLAIAGEGPERIALAALAKELGVQEHVFFDGWLPAGRMPAYLQQLDVLVLPSRTQPNWKEQFGRVLIEAMACQVAVVGSDSGEIPHVIGDAGLIFPEEDVDALSARLMLLQDREPRLKFGRAGRERVLDSYTQAQIAARTVEVYREMLA
jgi:glycosyltransferase involved in cell wall biosynthesis